MTYETGELLISIADLGDVVSPSDIEAKAVEEIKRLYPSRRLLIDGFHVAVMPMGNIAVSFSMWRLN